MTRISAARSALGTALAGTAILAVAVFSVVVMGAQTRPGPVAASFRPGELVATLDIAGQPVVWRLPGLVGVLILGPGLLAVTFLVFYVIGRRAAQPIETARRQQMRFTADASHELRTPLTLIEGEASLALGRERSLAEYRKSLERVHAESKRTRRLIDDLMWLARSDSDAVAPEFVLLDMVKLTKAAARRFEAVATRKDLDLSVAAPDPQPAMVKAPEEWMERLLGVLLDNACRYTPAGGAVRISARTTSDLTSLTVEDSGPGIPGSEAAHVFDRFHRATEEPGGAGLGLSIAAKVVADTGGEWVVGRSDLGGAMMTVRWRRGGRVGTRTRCAFREPSRSGR